jgi:hypothetical protein
MKMPNMKMCARALACASFVAFSLVISHTACAGELQGFISGGGGAFWGNATPPTSATWIATSFDGGPIGTVTIPIAPGVGSTTYLRGEPGIDFDALSAGVMHPESFNVDVILEIVPFLFALDIVQPTPIPSYIRDVRIDELTIIQETEPPMSGRARGRVLVELYGVARWVVPESCTVV